MLGATIQKSTKKYKKNHTKSMIVVTRTAEFLVIFTVCEQHGYVPWKAIFTSMPVYALTVCNFARSFVFYMLLTNQPSYMNVFKFSLAEVSER